MAEAFLWNELKAKKLGGYKFVRQMPIGPYYADFACRSASLIVEIDGSQHADSKYDRKRDEFVRGAGHSVLRMWNVDVLKEIDAVYAAILAALDGRLSEDTVAADMRFIFVPSTGRGKVKPPSPSRFARHLSPAPRGRGKGPGP